MKKGQNSEQPSVSVVIAARNEEGCIASCLTDLARQTYPQNRYEVIVINDGSSDGTVDVVKAFARERRNIRLLHAPDPMERGLSPKKNALDAGIRQATGEIILTTDADCRVLPTWIEGMIRYFEPDVGVVIGFSQIGKPDERLSLFERLQALDFLALMSAAAGSANIGIPLAASGQNFAYRRKVFEEVYSATDHFPAGTARVIGYRETMSSSSNSSDGRRSGEWSLPGQGGYLLRQWGRRPFEGSSNSESDGRQTDRISTGSTNHSLPILLLSLS